MAAALSVALIAVSAYFVAAPAAEGSRAGDLLATTQEAEPSAPADEPVADDPTHCVITGVGAGSCNVTVTVFGATDTVIIRCAG